MWLRGSASGITSEALWEIRGFLRSPVLKHGFLVSKTQFLRTQLPCSCGCGKKQRATIVDYTQLTHKTVGTTPMSCARAASSILNSALSRSPPEFLLASRLPLCLNWSPGALRSLRAGKLERFGLLGDFLWEGYRVREGTITQASIPQLSKHQAIMGRICAKALETEGGFKGCLRLREGKLQRIRPSTVNPRR